MTVVGSLFRARDDIEHVSKSTLLIDMHNDITVSLRRVRHVVMTLANGSINIIAGSGVHCVFATAA